MPLSGRLARRPRSLNSRLFITAHYPLVPSEAKAKELLLHEFPAPLASPSSLDLRKVVVSSAGLDSCKLLREAEIQVG